MIQKIKRNKNNTWFIGLINKFQGIGLSVNYDNPYAGGDEPIFIIEILFLWLKFWFVKYGTKKHI